MLTLGDPAPWFSCNDGKASFDLSLAPGPYLVLCFYGSTSIKKNLHFLQQVGPQLKNYFDGTRIAFLGVGIDPMDAQLTQLNSDQPGVRFLWDFDQRLSTLYGAVASSVTPGIGGVSYRSFTVILDPLLRVITCLPLQDEQHAQVLEAQLKQLPALDAYAGIAMHPPVLILPRVFEPEFCQQLIEVHQKNAGYESGFMAERGGQVIEIKDDKVKRRRDFAITVEEEEAYSDLRQMISGRIQRRLLPEIYKAFQFKVTRMERFLIGCYDSENQGFFRAHRDNFDPVTAHRRFACTINLNAEKHTGGALRFPEFGPKTYHVPTGAAIVFSCSLLHEALPVTEGQRFAFLPFFFDEVAAQTQKQQNMQTR